MLPYKHTPQWQWSPLKDHVPCYTVEHDKELKLSTWPPKSPDYDLVEHLSDVPEQV